MKFDKKATAYLIHKSPNEGRFVLHSDLNSFFASVACVKEPALRQVPTAVCGATEERHGIVLAKNELAKACGVLTGETIGSARTKCPSLVIRTPHYDDYLAYSRAVHAIYGDYSDRVEPFGMDEAWLELTNMAGVKSLEDAARTAHHIRKRVLKETGLTVSVGVSDNKTFAKLASDYKKPNAVTVFSPDCYISHIAPLPLSSLLFAGPHTTEKLRHYGIYTIGDVAQNDGALFHTFLGKCGDSLYDRACGFDVSPVEAAGFERVIKSVGNSMTTPRDMVNQNDLAVICCALCEEVGRRLRDYGLQCRGVAVSLRSADLSWCSREASLSAPTDCTDVLFQEAMALSLAVHRFPAPLRSFGVRAIRLSPRREQQLSWFEGLGDERHRKRDAVADAICQKFGKNAIRRATVYSDPTLYRNTAFGHTEQAPSPFTSFRP